jgi:hypothetical protein
MATFRFKVSLRRVAPRARYARLPASAAADGALPERQPDGPAGPAGRATARKPHNAQKPPWCRAARAGGALNHIRACGTPQNHLVLERCITTEMAHNEVYMRQWG